MNEAQWLASEDPQAMLQHVRNAPNWHLSPPQTARKLSLFACACVGCEEDDIFIFFIFDVGGVFPNTRDPRNVSIRLRWKDSNDDSDTVNTSKSHAEAAALLRDIVGNPFRPVRRIGHEIYWPNGTHGQDWWLTPTVLDLARAAYYERWRVCDRCGGSGQIENFIARGTGDNDTTRWREVCPRCANGSGLRGTGRIDDGTLDPDRLGVLSDALEEAGCTDPDIINHLRGKERCWLCVRTKSDPDKDACSVCGQLGAVGPYGRPCAPGWLKKRAPCVRGCWVVDLLLGNE